MYNTLRLEEKDIKNYNSDLDLIINLGKEQSIVLSKGFIESLINYFNKIEVEETKFKSYKDITSFELACEYLDIKFVYNDGLNASEIALRKLKLIVKAFNKLSGFISDFENISQYKYYPYFEIKNGSFVFGYCSFNYGLIFLPSVLCVSTSEEATFLGKTFTDLYKDYILN